MSQIKVVSNPTPDQLRSLGVAEWEIWECEPTEYPHTYEDHETCYVLRGEVTVTPDGAEPVKIGPGDLVEFDKGLKCTWKITKAVRKHYVFS